MHDEVKQRFRLFHGEETERNSFLTERPPSEQVMFIDSVARVTHSEIDLGYVSF